MPTLPVHQVCFVKPVDHFERVVLLLLGIFIMHQSFGIAIAAHVDAHRGIAMAGEIRMSELIAHDRPVALAIGEIFEDRRHRLLFGILRQPDARGEASRHPTASIQRFSISLTLRGKSVTIFMRGTSGNRGRAQIIMASRPAKAPAAAL